MSKISIFKNYIPYTPNFYEQTINMFSDTCNFNKFILWSHIDLLQVFFRLLEHLGMIMVRILLKFVSKLVKIRIENVVGAVSNIFIICWNCIKLKDCSIRYRTFLIRYTLYTDNQLQFQIQLFTVCGSRLRQCSKDRKFFLQLVNVWSQQWFWGGLYNLSRTTLAVSLNNYGG